MPTTAWPTAPAATVRTDGATTVVGGNICTDLTVGATVTVGASVCMDGAAYVCIAGAMMGSVMVCSGAAARTAGATTVVAGSVGTSTVRSTVCTCGTCTSRTTSWTCGTRTSRTTS